VEGSVDASQNQNTMTLDNIHKANDVGQDLKKAWLQGVVDFGTKAETTAWQPSTVKEVQPLTLDTTTVRDWGQPPFEEPYGDTRKIANPHSSDFYTVGSVYPTTRWSDKFK